ncbi:MAG: gliding motility-associated C-terminal domain-containing protein, partial [Sediminibacterium sp.]|nr:gliding motility-associated C-terminal domain-containing protein [Sediminibacterium sp.]
KYKLDSILLNDTLLIKDSLTSYTFYKITSNQKINLFFSLAFDTIFVSENIVGAGIYDSQTIANAGDTIAVFYKPSSLKYKLDSILLNDTLLVKDSLTSFTFYKITSNQKIKLFFSLVLDTIFISENIVGAGIYNSQTIAIIGDTIAVFYKPSSLKYKLDSILLNNTLLVKDSLTSFTFYKITSNQKIKLFFSVIFDSIFISTNIPSGINFISLYKVVRTDSIRIMYHTLYNYRIDSIIINDTLFNKDSLSNYTFKNIVGNQKLRLIISRIYTPPVIKIQLDTIPKFYCANTSTNIIVRLMIKVQATADSNTYLNSKLVRYQWYVSNKPDTLLGKPIAGAQGLLYSFDTTLFLLPLNINFGIPLDSEAYYYVSFENNYDTQKLYSNFSGLIVFKNIIANTIKIDTFNKVSPRQSSEAVKISLTGASYYFISPALYAFPSIAVSDQYIYLKPTESTLFKIIGIDEYGCVLDDSLFVPVDSFFDIDIYPTKVITPNNDGINDYWVIHNILYYPNNKIVIYNRMNQVVKSFVNFTPFTRWNGNSTFDNILSNGQYFYFIECYDINNRIIKSKKGDFIIRRN